MNFLHQKDAGDCILSLASVQAMGGGNYFFKPCQNSPFRLLEGLVARQEYIQGVSVHRREKIDVDFSNFRKGGIPWGVRLAELHSNWVGAKVDFSKPWLKVDPDKRAAGKIIVSKTSRYSNQYFPWKALTDQYHSKMIFVGLEQEWKTFCSKAGHYIQFFRTKDLNEVARLIAGSELLIGNQSSPMAIAEGLKHPIIQEVSLTVPDCIFPRANAIHCFNGNLDCEILGEEFSVRYVPPKVRLPVHVTPPGGWKVLVNNRIQSHYCFRALQEKVQRELLEESPINICNMIQDYTVSGLDLDSIPSWETKQLERVRRLIEDYATASTIKDSDKYLSLPESSGTRL